MGLAVTLRVGVAVGDVVGVSVGALVGEEVGDATGVFVKLVSNLKSPVAPPYPWTRI